MAITPNMVRLAEQFRAALLRREKGVAVTMLQEYGTVWAGLKGQLDDLQVQMAARRAAGEEISKGMLWRETRIKALQVQVREQALQLADVAGDMLTEAQRQAIMQGEREAYQLLLAGLPPEAGALIQFDRLPTSAIESLVGVMQDGSPLSDLLREALGEAADGFMERLVEGLASGWNPRKLAKVLRDEFGMGLTRAMRIARTEMLRAYRTATLRQYQQSDVVTGWERHATKDNRTCMACIMLDGTTYTLEVAMDDHVNGRCAMLPITKTWRELGFDIDEPDFSRQLGSDWFQEQDEATQRHMMGPGLYDAWQSGQVGLDDIPKKISDPVWGDSWVPAPLKDLVPVEAV